MIMNYGLFAFPRPLSITFSLLRFVSFNCYHFVKHDSGDEWCVAFDENPSHECLSCLSSSLQVLTKSVCGATVAAFFSPFFPLDLSPSHSALLTALLELFARFSLLRYAADISRLSCHRRGRRLFEHVHRLKARSSSSRSSQHRNVNAASSHLAH